MLHFLRKANDEDEIAKLGRIRFSLFLSRPSSKHDDDVRKSRD